MTGGSTPAGLYQALAGEPYRDRIAWEHVVMLWGDERYVPHDDADSNYRLVRENLLDHVSCDEENIYPMPTNLPNRALAADTYHQQVQAILKDNDGMFDMLLLGLGPDGHVASLFPHNAALDIPSERLVVAVDDSPKPPPQRLTLTVTALNRATQVLFLVAGQSKADAVYGVLQGEVDPRHMPARMVQPSRGRVTWMLDEEAASKL
jgi:6-phosphogluconolactonase